MHSKSDNIEIMINDKADGITEERFQWRFCRYQTALETSMKAGDFAFECAHSFYYKCG